MNRPKWLPRRPNGWTKWVDTYAEYDDGNHIWESSTLAGKLCIRIELTADDAMYLVARNEPNVEFSLCTRIEHAELAVEVLKASCLIMDGFEDWG